MVRAVVHKGAIEPLTPLPPTWSDGRELIIREAEPSESIADLDAWAAEVEAAVAEIPPEDHDRFEAALAEQDREAKAYIRRLWGLV